MARLPQPGGDNGSWGEILNDYLSQIHNADGSLKSNIVTNDAIAQDAITASEIADGAIQEAQLAPSVQTKLNAMNGTVSWDVITGKPSVIAAGTNQAAAKSAIGLSNVDNTSDANKPVSTATQSALNAKVSGTGVSSIVAITQTAYNALTPDPNTFYVITGP